MPFGILDTRHIDLPANIDARYIEGLRTRAGVSFPDIMRDIDSRLGALNTALDSLLASLIYPTTEIYAEDTESQPFDVEERGEFTIARPQTAEGSAHMLPLGGIDVTLGLTEDGLESLSRRKIQQQVDSLLDGIRRSHRRRVLRRLFSDAEVRVDQRTIMTSPGFAGSGTGLNVFTRPHKDGQPLEAGYSHYYRIAAAALAAGLKNALARLRRRHEGPFDLIAPQAIIDLIAATPDFVGAGSALIRLGNGQSEATVDPNVYVGVFDKDVRVRKPIADFSDQNIAIYKTFGDLNPRNPLAWRYDEQKGRGAVIRSRALYPLADANVKQDLGIGVNNRTAAILIRVADAGGYEAPAGLSA